MHNIKLTDKIKLLKFLYNAKLRPDLQIELSISILRDGGNPHLAILG